MHPSCRYPSSASEGSTLSSFPSLLNSLFLYRSRPSNSLWEARRDTCSGAGPGGGTGCRPRTWVVCVRGKLFYWKERNRMAQIVRRYTPEFRRGAEQRSSSEPLASVRGLWKVGGQSAGLVRWTEGSESGDRREVSDRRVLVVSDVEVNCVRLRGFRWIGTASVSPLRSWSASMATAAGASVSQDGRAGAGTRRTFCGVSPGRWRTSKGEPRPTPRKADGPRRCERGTTR